MLEGFVADLLEKVLGQYIRGIERQKVKLGVWNGDLELHDLSMKSEALEMIFELLGMDLPVSVTAGSIKKLTVQVPWKNLRSKSVKILIDTLQIKAAPTSVLDLSALKERERRIKKAQLIKDDTVRLAKRSVSGVVDDDQANDNQPDQDSTDRNNSGYQNQNPSSVKETWSGWMTQNIVTKIADNIQLEILNVSIDFIDTISDPQKPILATLKLDSLSSHSANLEWEKVFVEDTDSPVIHKLSELRGLQISWEPLHPVTHAASEPNLHAPAQNQASQSVSGLPTVSSTPSPSKSAPVSPVSSHHSANSLYPVDNISDNNMHSQDSLYSEHILLYPVSTVVRMVFRKPSWASTSQAQQKLRYQKLPQACIDIQFPDISLNINNFQYSSILKTAAHLAEFHNKGKQIISPQTPKDKWLWAIEKLLPGYKFKLQAKKSLTLENIKKVAQIRQNYIDLRKLYIQCLYNMKIPSSSIVQELETLEDQLDTIQIIVFRDIVDSMVENETFQALPSSKKSKFWSYFSRPTLNSSSSQQSTLSSLTQKKSTNTNDVQDIQSQDSSEFSLAQSKKRGEKEKSKSSKPSSETPQLRLGLLLQKGAAALNNFDEESAQLMPCTHIVFEEFRFGIELNSGNGFLFESLLKMVQVADLVNNRPVLYRRVHKGSYTTSHTSSCGPNNDDQSSKMNSFPQRVTEALHELRLYNRFKSATSTEAFSSPKSQTNPTDQDENQHSRDMPAYSSPINSTTVSANSPNELAAQAFPENSTTWIDSEDSPNNQVQVTYIAALRLKRESVSVDDSLTQDSTRLGLDFALGGIEIIVDGPSSALGHLYKYWAPQKDVEPIIHMLRGAAALRVAKLRAELQNLFLKRKNPMRMNISIAAPKIVVPLGTSLADPHLIVDLGQLAIQSEESLKENVFDQGQKRDDLPEVLSYMSYGITAAEVSVYISPVNSNTKIPIEILLSPVSTSVMLRVLRNSSLLAAYSLPSEYSERFAKIKLQGHVPDLKFFLHHRTYRKLLNLIHHWRKDLESLQLAKSTEEKSDSDLSFDDQEIQVIDSLHIHEAEENNSLRDFDMDFLLSELSLELRDKFSHRLIKAEINNIRSTVMQNKSRFGFRFQVEDFLVVDTSRGTHSKFQRLLYTDRGMSDFEAADEERTFASISYNSYSLEKEKTLDVELFTLGITCARETYVALFKFLYGSETGTQEEYVDPFKAMGTTVGRAAKQLKEGAEKVANKGAEALSSTGKITLSVAIGGVCLLLASAEGALASLDIKKFSTVLLKSDTDGTQISGNIGSFIVSDLTAKFPSHVSAIKYNNQKLDDVGIESLKETGINNWMLQIPVDGLPILRSNFSSLKIVYLHKFIFDLKDYFLELRNSIFNIFNASGANFDADGFGEIPLDQVKPVSKRFPLRFDILTTDVDIVLPRSSSINHEALRLIISRSLISNESVQASEDYNLSFNIITEGLNAFSLYPHVVEENLPTMDHSTDITNFIPFINNCDTEIRVDLSKRDPADGDQISEFEGNADKDTPAIKVSLRCPKPIVSDLWEAQYTILVFALMENFTEVVKATDSSTEPLSHQNVSSVRKPSLVKVYFNISKVINTLSRGKNPLNPKHKLIKAIIENLQGYFEVGVDARIYIEASAKLKSIMDIRNNKEKDFMKPYVITKDEGSTKESDISFTYDRPFQKRAQIMLVAPTLRLCLDRTLTDVILGLTIPGYPYLTTSPPAAFVPFFGRQLIATVSKPEILIFADQYKGDRQALLFRGDILVRIEWEPVTRIKSYDIYARDFLVGFTVSDFSKSHQQENMVEAPLIYPCDISMEILPEVDSPLLGKIINLNIDSLISRIAVQDASLLLAAGSKLKGKKIDKNEMDEDLVIPKIDNTLPNVGDSSDIIEERSLTLSLGINSVRCVFTDEAGGSYVPILEIRLRSTQLRSRWPWMTNFKTELSADLFNEQRGWWSSGIEPWTFELASSLGRSGTKAYVLNSPDGIDLNISPSIISGFSKVVTSFKNAYSALFSGTVDPAKLSKFYDRPSVAAYCVKNDSGRPIMISLPFDSTRKMILDQQEFEVNIPTDQTWMFLNPNNSAGDQKSLLRCKINFQGYEQMDLSVEEVSVQSISCFSEKRSSGDLNELLCLWDVSMRDGVPVGTLRSLLRFKNETKTTIEIAVGDESPQIFKVAENSYWSVPIKYVGSSIRLRPQIFSDDDTYLFKWSDPVSRIQHLRNISILIEKETSNRKIRGSQDESLRYSQLHSSLPVLACRSIRHSMSSFFIMVFPEMDRLNYASLGSKGPDWIDVKLSSPLIIENLLPKPLFIQLSAKKDQAVNNVVVKDIAPLEARQLNSSGVLNLKDSLIFCSYSNDDKLALTNEIQSLVNEYSGEMYCKLAMTPKNDRKMTEFLLNVEGNCTPYNRKLIFYADFWIRNRSGVHILVRDTGAGYSTKTKFLRANSPQHPADSYTCLTGQFMSFALADHDGNQIGEWWSIQQDINEVDKPVELELLGASVVVEVKQARGKYFRTLVVTIRNSFWLRNRAGVPVQWCQYSSLDRHGIVLKSNVHTVLSDDIGEVHFITKEATQSIALRFADEYGNSDWIWSRAFLIERPGEALAKMYRPSTHEQYIARVTISKLKGGSKLVTIYPEDRTHPPYKIKNLCSSRSIAFRQLGGDKARPWLIRAGRSSRYSWDDPNAPKRRRILLLEVIEHSENQDKAYPEFQLDIDAQGKVQADLTDTQPLYIYVKIDGPTKTVTFSDFDFDKYGNTLDSSLALPADSIPVIEWSDIKEEVDKRSSALEEKKYDVVDFEVWLAYVGISLVNSSPQELAYIFLSEIRFHAESARDGAKVLMLDIDNVQIDNQLKKPAWPVTLYSPPLDEKSDSTRSAKKPVVQISFEISPGASENVILFKGIFVAIQKLCIAADEDLITKFYMFAQEIIHSGFTIEDEGIDENDQDMKDFSQALRETTILVVSKRVYIEKLLLNAVDLSVSFMTFRSSSSVDRTSINRNLIRIVLATFGNVENARIRFNALELYHAFDTVGHLKSLVQEFYLQQINSQKLKLVASNSLVGNPSALFDSIAVGTKDFFLEPAKAKTSLDFIVGLGKGSSSLVTNTVGGIFGSIGGIPRAMARGLETAVGDKTYLAERESIRGVNSVSQTPVHGLYRGALSLGHGIASGAAGLIRDPYQGIVEDGAVGFFRGLGKGVIGVALKPLTGALDLIAEPAAGLRYMITKQRKVSEPVRPPRAFLGRNGQLIQYDFRKSIGQQILVVASHAELYPEEILVDWIELTEDQFCKNDAFLPRIWDTVRKFTRLGVGQKRKTKDANIDRLEKTRVALVTSVRLMIATFEGRSIWECRLRDIVGTQVSVEAKDYLMLGVSSSGVKQNVGSTSWNRIHCGSISSRDSLNRAIRMMIGDKSRRLLGGGGIHEELYNKGSMELPDMKRIQSGKDNMTKVMDVGMVVEDVANSDEETAEDGTSSSISSRRIELNQYALNEYNIDMLLHVPSRRKKEAHRSVFGIIANETGKKITLTGKELRFGVWRTTPSKTLENKTVGFWEVDSGQETNADIVGVIFFDIEGAEDCIMIKFESLTLSNENKYSLHGPPGIYGSFERGQGRHSRVIIRLKHRPTRTEEIAGNSVQHSNNSNVPENTPGEDMDRALKDIEDMNLDQLVDLGFDKELALDALRKSDGDIVKAVDRLLSGN